MPEATGMRDNFNAWIEKTIGVVPFNAFIGLLIGLVVACLISVSFHYKLFKDFEIATISWRFKYFNHYSKPSDKCVVVGINSESIKKYGKLPWNRKMYAELTEALSFYGAKGVLIDVYFIGRHNYFIEGDKLFVDAVKKVRDKTFVILAAVGEVASKSVSHYSEAELRKINEFSLKPEKPVRTVDVSYFHYEFFTRVYSKLTPEEQEGYGKFLTIPYDELLNVVSGLGFINISSNTRQIIKTPLIMNIQGNDIPSLPLAGYVHSISNKKIVQKPDSLVVGDAEIPVYGNNEYMINWYNAPVNMEKAYKIISVLEVIESYRFLQQASRQTGLSKDQIQDKLEQFFICMEKNNCPADLMAFFSKFPSDASATLRGKYYNKFVFIGPLDTEGDKKDFISSPIANDMPGVILHANILDNLLQKDFIHYYPLDVTYIIFFVLAIMTGFTVLGAKSSNQSVISGFLAMFYFVVPLAFFNFHKVYIDLFYTQLAVMLTVGVCVIFKYIVADKDKRVLRKTFSNYLAPQIFNEILSDPAKINLGGTKKEITILFSDIRGFTSISEKTSPEGVVSFLNEYFDAMVDELLKTEGSIDKFIGDAIMAFWGAPLACEDHAKKAVLGAIGMIDALEVLKQKWIAEGKNYPDINIGIGINTGDAIVGNVGSSKIRSYTIIGDSVNLASRLEGLNKEYAKHGINGKNIIISEFTYNHVKDFFEVIFLDKVKVKGKDEEVAIYKVVGIKGDAHEKTV